MERTVSPLTQEVEHYEAIKPTLWPAHDGEYVVIKNREVLGIFATHDEAYVAGLQAFGNVPMLVRKILEKQPVIMLFSISA